MHISTEAFAFRAYSGWAFGVFFLPDKVPWLDSIGVYNSLGVSLELWFDQGSPFMRAEFKEEGPILALNVVACLLSVAFLKNVERLEEALERKPGEVAGKAESSGKGR